MLAQEIQKAQIAFDNDPYKGSIFRHFAEGWLIQYGTELNEAIAAVDSYLQIAEEAEDELYNEAWDMMDILVNDEGMSWVTFESCYNAISEVGIDGAYSVIGGM